MIRVLLDMQIHLLHEIAATNAVLQESLPANGALSAPSPVGKSILVIKEQAMNAQPGKRPPVVGDSIFRR